MLMQPREIVRIAGRLNWPPTGAGFGYTTNGNIPLKPVRPLSRYVISFINLLDGKGTTP